MPFKTKTQNAVKTCEEIKSHQQAPLSQEGLNGSNLGGFELAPISTQEQSKKRTTSR